MKPSAHPRSADRTHGWEHVVDAIGPKIRRLRQQLGLSLQQLAGRAEVSAAAIHKVERGEMVPTITTLLKLSAALDRPVGFFIDDGTPDPVAVHRPWDERTTPPADWASTLGGVSAESLARPHGPLRAGAVAATVPPGGSGTAAPQRTGEEILLVDEGTLVVEVAGERHVVESGDTLHYPTDRPRSWRNDGGETVRAIWWYVHD